MSSLPATGPDAVSRLSALPVDGAFGSDGVNVAVGVGVTSPVGAGVEGALDGDSGVRVDDDVGDGVAGATGVPP